MKPNDSQVHFHFGSCIRAGLVYVHNLVWKGKWTSNWAPRTPLKRVWSVDALKCSHIVHLDLICMSYDQKKGWESNWKFDSWPQIPWKQGSNEVLLKHVIHFWKDIYKGYKILSSYFQNRFDLIKIWTSKVLGQQESQFWNSHLGVPRKNDIWM